jgi:hypothetical protein
LLSQTTQATRQLREALENEYRAIVVGDRHFTPSEAARFVAQHPRSARLDSSAGQTWAPT